jgi:hypothetical protein
VRSFLLKRKLAIKMVCKQGHEFHDKLSCPICAQDASAAMLVEFMERAIRNRERVYRILDHHIVGPDYWRPVLREQGVGLNDLAVPALCGATVALSEVSRQVGRVLKAIQEEQPGGKCRKCETRLAALSAETNAKSV